MKILKHPLDNIWVTFLADRQNPSPVTEKVWKNRFSRRASGDIGKVLDLPARSRFGEGRAVPFHRQLLTVKNLNHSRSLAEPCDLCPSKAAILKLWRYLRSTESRNFFTPSEGLRDLWKSGILSRQTGFQSFSKRLCQILWVTCFAAEKEVCKHGCSLRVNHSKVSPCLRPARRGYAQAGLKLYQPAWPLPCQFSVRQKELFQKSLWPKWQYSAFKKSLHEAQGRVNF